MKIKSFFTLLLLLGIMLPVFAQLAQPLRVEVEMENDRIDHFLIPMKENGLVSFYPSYNNVNERNNAKWIFTGYNTNFEQKWKSAFVINDAYIVVGKSYSNNTLYILFKREHREAITLAIINTATGVIQSKAAKLPRGFSVLSLEEAGKIVYISGEWRKKPALAVFSPETGILENIALKFDGKATYESVEADAQKNEINIIYSVIKRGKSFLTLKTFKGKNLINDLVIKPEGTDNLLTGKISTIDENEKIIIGTYAAKGNSGSSGMYFARLLNNSQLIIKYYNFTNFARFFDFLPEREKEKIQKQKNKKQKKGKELNLNYRLLVHDLILRNGEYILVAESYYATYRSQPYSYTTFINGVPIIQTRYVSVFDGWAYTHAIVAGFDLEGTMLWDNCIEMGDVKSFTLKPRVCANVSNDRAVTLVYATDGKIKTKVIKGTLVLDDKEAIPIKTGFADDVVKRSDLANINPWYKQYFLIWGYQEIKNDGLESAKRRRTVFYFNKVAYP